jgi:hypothetical protein
MSADRMAHKPSPACCLRTRIARHPYRCRVHFELKKGKGPNQGPLEVGCV